MTQERGVEAPRPRLSTEHEAKLAETEIERTRSYEAIEIVTEQMKEVADALSGDEEAVPIVIEPDDEESLVTSIEGVRAAVNR